MKNAIAFIIDFLSFLSIYLSFFLLACLFYFSLFHIGDFIKYMVNFYSLFRFKRSIKVIGSSM